MNSISISSRLLEKIGHSGNRLKVSMQDGKIVGELDKEHATQESIMSLCFS